MAITVSFLLFVTAIATSGCICCIAPGSGTHDNQPFPAQIVVPGTVFTQPATATSTVSTPVITNTPTQKPAPLTEIMRLPTGTYIARNVSSGEGELSIENGLDEDAVILITSEANPKKTIIGVYIRAGDRFIVTGIPDGNYIVYYRIGLDWDINTNQFTRSETSERFEELLSYETTSDLYTSYELTLQKVEGGNAETYDVSDSEMPSV